MSKVMECKGKLLVAVDSGELEGHALFVANKQALAVCEGVVLERQLRKREKTTKDPRLLNSLNRCKRPTSELTQLDENGLIQVGSVVQQGSILVGIARESESPLEPEERLLKAIFGQPKECLRWIDTSLVWPHQEKGVVIKSEKINGAAYRVVVAVLRPLCEGDILEDVATRKRYLVAGFRPDERADIIAPAQTLEPGQRIMKKVGPRLRADKLAVRATGPYTAYGLPVSSGPERGQLLKEDEVSLLDYWFFLRCLEECFVLKSGGVRMAEDVYEDITKGAISPQEYSILPEITYALIFSLRGLGLNPVFLDRKGETLTLPKLTSKTGTGKDFFRAAALRIEPASSEMIEAWSSGAMTEGEAVIRGKPRAGGLFCPRIFSDRETNMGHIPLPIPMVNPFFLPGIGQRIGMPQEALRSIALGSAEITDSLSGSEAIRHLLTQKGCDPEPFFLKAIPVIPLGLRFGQPDLHWLYQRVINRSGRLAKLIKLKAPQIIIRNEEAMLFKGLSELFFGDRKAGLDEMLQRILRHLFQRRIDYSGSGVVIPDSRLKFRHVGLPFSFAAKLFFPHFLGELRRREIFSKAMAWEIRRKLEQDKTLQKILCSLVRRFLLLVIARKEGEPVLAVLRPIVQTEIKEALSLHPRTAEALGIKFKGERVKILLPITKYGQEEAKDFLYPREKNPAYPLSPVPHCTLGGRRDLEANLRHLGQGQVEKLAALALERITIRLEELDRLALGL